MLYYDLVTQRRSDPRDDLLTKLIESELECENGEKRKLDDLEIAGFATLLGGAGPRQSPSWSAMRRWFLHATPSSGRSCSTIAARSQPRWKNYCATKRPPSIRSAAR
ncbi:cytochrome P450 family protein [Mycobacterium xenopi 3993]|nr:cytochrome P450 family protein [Mycobacterium xenopi 3993]